MEIESLAVEADDSVGPLGNYEFAADFRKNSAFRRVDVGIDPYSEMRKCIRMRRSLP